MRFFFRPLLAAACFALGGAVGGITLNAAPPERDLPAEPIEARRAASGDAGDGPSSRPADTANKDVPKRAPKKRLRAAGSPAGRFYDTESMPITIQGTAKDQDGRPLPGVAVFVGLQNQFVASGQDVLARTTTDQAGKYVLKDMMLPVRTFPPKPDVAEGKFQVFGVSEGHGFAWHGVRAYRPRPRPPGDSEPEMDRAYYQGETITNDLVFRPTVRFTGQVMDDLGRPVAGAKVQIGVIHDARRPGSKMYRFQSLAPIDSPVDPDGNFTSIHYMPESQLSTTTDPAGRYEFPHVPRDATFIAGVSATAELGNLSETVTSGNPIDDDDGGGKTVIWSPILTAPRSVLVRATDETGKQPLDGVLLHAYGRQAHFAGNEARSDGDGRCFLRLPPGHYRLTAEPASGSMYARTEQEIEVAKEPIEQGFELGVRPGALVILKAALDDGRPVEGVRFNYETDTSRDRLELQSQTVFIDHPATDGNGVLRAVVEPGRRQFFVSQAPDGYEAAESESRWIEVAAGRETTVAFKLRKKPQVDVPDAPADDDDLERRLQLLWRRQNDFKFKGAVNYRMTSGSAGEYVVTRDEIRQVIAAFDVNAALDIAAWINRHLPELNVRFAGPYRMLIDGQRHRRDAITPLNPGTLTDIEVFNGAEIVRYNAANAQVSVDDYRASFVHIDGVDDLRRWPYVPRPIPEGRSDRKAVSREEGKVVFERQSDDVAGRLVVDEATGFVYEDSFYQQAAGNGRDKFQFAPIELPGGMIWPRLRIVLDYQKGELSIIRIHDVSSIEPNRALPADALVVSLPAGTLVLASDFGAAALERGRNQPGSPKQGLATGPVTDAVQFAYSLSPKSRSLWPVLKIGQEAPALNAATWLTKDGASETPDLKDKVVLVDFWGQGCGPCVAELPKLVNLAGQFAKTDLRIVGWHDSSGDVEGVARFARKHGLPYLLAIDHEADEPGWFGALFKSYGVRAIPQSALIDRQGKIVFVGTLAEAVSRLENLLGEAAR